MAIYFVATSNREHDGVLKARIAEHFPSNYFELGRGQWLVSFKGTARELYSRMVPEYTTATASQSPLNSTLVVGIAGYWGVASRDIWEWIKIKSQESASA